MSYGYLPVRTQAEREATPAIRAAIVIAYPHTSHGVHCPR